MKAFALARTCAIFATVTLAAAAAAARQEPSSAAGGQASPFKEIRGLVTTMDYGCTYFTLKAQSQQTEIRFLRDTHLGSWVRGPGGCNIAFSVDERLLLKPAMTVTVRYVVEEDKNIVRGFIVPPEDDPAILPDQCAILAPTPPSLGHVYSVGCGVREAKCVYCPQPRYDKQAKKRRVEGPVLLNLIILPDGTVYDSRVIRSVDEGLDKSALESVRKWRYEPVIGPGGKPVIVSTWVEVIFSLR